MADLIWLNLQSLYELRLARKEVGHQVMKVPRLTTSEKQPTMRIPVTKGQLTELVRRAEAGDEVILTRHGQPAVRLVPVKPVRLNPRQRRKLLEAIRAAGAAKASPGASAARGQDFLYDESGLPK
jgi:prevent-host-death family protein